MVIICHAQNEVNPIHFSARTGTVATKMSSLTVHTKDIKMCIVKNLANISLE